MPNELVVLEKQFEPLAPRFAQVLPPGLPVERLIRTVMVSVERMPKLLDCERQSLFNAAMTAAVLGLEVDGATGQAFLIPFKSKAQLVIGYKGYTTLAARSGLTVTGGVVREEDEFEFDEGEGWVKHKRKLGGEDKRRIIAAWAKAAAHDRPAVVKVLSIDEILEVKKKSPGARRDDSPWNDPQIGFPAMAEKTAKRRLARSMPLNVMQTAARMDEAFDEQGVNSWIAPDKTLQIESPLPEREAEAPTTAQLIEQPKQEPDDVPSAKLYSELWDSLLKAATDANEIRQSWQAGKKLRDRIKWPEDENHEHHWTQIMKRANAKRAELTKAA